MSKFKIALPVSLTLTASFLSLSDAHACSFDLRPNNAFHYDTLDQGRMNSPWARQKKRQNLGLNALFGQLDVLIIAKPAEDSIVSEAPSVWYKTESDEREYRRIRWDVIETIKGDPIEPLYVRDLKAKISATLSQSTETNADKAAYGRSQSQARETFIENVEKRVENRNSFTFWDAPEIANVTMVDVTQMTSCGPIYIPAYDFNRHYLVGLNKNGATVFAEPLKDETDSLVEATKRFVETRRLAPDLPHGDFFSEMETRDIVEIQSCSLELQNRNATSQNWLPYDEASIRGFSSNFEFPEDIKFKRIGKSSETSVDTQKLSKNYPALLEYFDNDKSKVECRPGEQFAIYADKDQYAAPTHFAFFPIIPEYRYARVQDGKIRLDDIRTNYTLTGTENISIEEFLNPKKQTDAPK